MIECRTQQTRKTVTNQANQILASKFTICMSKFAQRAAIAWKQHVMRQSGFGVTSYWLHVDEMA